MNVSNTCARLALPAALRRGLAGFILVMSLFGCVTVTPEPVVIREPAPTPIPLTVAVHYSDALRSYVHTEAEGPGGSFTIGQASVKLFGEALALLFAKVVPSDEPLNDAIAARIDPMFTRVRYCFSIQCGQSSTATGVLARASVTYTVALRSRDGRELARWDVAGVGVAVPVQVVEGGNTSVKRAFELAMRDAAFKLVNEFREVPGVQAWLAEQGVTQVSR